MDRQLGWRLWEIDALRGLALVLMIFYHLLYDLNVFFDYNIAYSEGLFYLIGKAAATLFILVAGISCAFSKSNARRALKLILWGYVIFLVTFIAMPGSNIVFGILQFLGVCFLLYPLFKDIPPYLLAAAGTIIILADNLTAHITVSHSWLVPLGFYGPNFSSVDYFPLIPWLGVFLLGVAIRKTVYKENKSLLNVSNKYLRPLAAVGKHTLIIYLVHQPLILVILYLLLNPQGLMDMIEKVVPR